MTDLTDATASPVELITQLFHAEGLIPGQAEHTEALGGEAVRGPTSLARAAAA